MKRKKISICLASFFILAGAVHLSHAAESTPASLRVMMVDENGSLVHSAHIYIFSRNKKKFFGTREAQGVSSFDLPSGDYRVFAGFSVKIDGIVDHYTSPETCIHVSADEPTSVILSLQKAQDPEMILSDTARQKMGIDEELAKYVN